MTNEAEAREQSAQKPTTRPSGFKTSENFADLAAAFCEAQKKFKPPKKTATATIKSDRANYSYKYAPLDEVLDATRPALNEFGLSLIQNTWTVSANAVGVQTILLHTSGQMFVFDPLVFPSGGTPQSAGAAITYAKRYSASAALGVAAEEDTDAQGQLPGGTKRQVRTDDPNAPANVPKTELPAERQTTTQQSGPAKTITKPQAARLKQICNVHGVGQKTMKAFLNEWHIDSVDTIPSDKYDAVVRAVQEGQVGKAAASA